MSFYFSLKLSVQNLWNDQPSLLNICVIWSIINQIHCISLVFLSGITRFYMPDYIFSRFGSSYFTRRTFEIKFSDIFLNIVPIVCRFPNLFYSWVFSFRWEPWLIWFWYIISSVSNFCGIIYHSSFTHIFLCGELLLDFLLFVLVLYCLFSIHSFFVDFFFCRLVFYIWKSINIYINKPIIRIFTNI